MYSMQLDRATEDPKATSMITLSVAETKLKVFIRKNEKVGEIEKPFPAYKT